MERPPEDKPPTGGERKQKRLIKYRRANVVLTEDEVQEIKAGRKKLRPGDEAAAHLLQKGV